MKHTTHKKKRHTKLLTAVLCGAVLFSSSASLLAANKGLYRWVDDKGVVHYGDHVPPEYSKKERQILNKQAVVIDTLAAEKTKEQLAQEADERKRQAELRRKAAEKAHHDRLLLATYSNPDEIDNALAGDLASVDNQINVIKINIEQLRKQRSTILDRISYFGENEAEADEDTIAKLEAQLSSTNDELTNSITRRNSLNSQKDELTLKYGNDKTQFIKLKLQREESTMAENHPLL